jgi:hypothetical protein
MAGGVFTRAALDPMSLIALLFAPDRGLAKRHRRGGLGILLHIPKMAALREPPLSRT